ncbi:MAG TPA: hypothetical protein VMU03_15060 [Gammaproteobacteria bacterium]|nr:hypothetical protein [Gammaproteobacteria bacterium]
MHDTIHGESSARRARNGARGPALAVLLGASAVVVAVSVGAADGVPRMADGHPDLSGTWDNGSGIEFVQPQKRGDSVCVVGCGPAGAAALAAAATAAPAGRPSYKPELQAKVADLSAHQVQTDPVLRCFSPGVPRIGPPDKIVQRANELLFLYDDVSGNFFRIVPTDGRAHRKDVSDAYLGDAVGHWEGDTLVVETIGFNDETWLTDDGAFHTRDLRVVEKLQRTADTLEWTATAYDPKVLTEPWALKTRIAHRTDQEIAEAAPCIERDLDHIVDGSHHTNPR